MCMEDVEIKRNTKTRIYQLFQESFNIPGNANRLSIRVVPYATATGTVIAIGANCAYNSAGGDVTLGYSYRGLVGVLSDSPSGLLPDDITLDKVGDMLLGPLRLTAADQACTFIETYLDCPTGKPKGCI